MDKEQKATEDFIFELLEMELDAEYGNVTGKEKVRAKLIDWMNARATYWRNALSLEHSENKRLSEEIKRLKEELLQERQQIVDAHQERGELIMNYERQIEFLKGLLENQLRPDEELIMTTKTIYDPRIKREEPSSNNEI